MTSKKELMNRLRSADAAIDSMNSALKSYHEENTALRRENYILKCRVRELESRENEKYYPTYKEYPVMPSEPSCITFSWMY